MKEKIIFYLNIVVLIFLIIMFNRNMSPKISNTLYTLEILAFGIFILDYTFLKKLRIERKRTQKTVHVRIKENENIKIDNTIKDGILIYKEDTLFTLPSREQIITTIIKIAMVIAIAKTFMIISQENNKIQKVRYEKEVRKQILLKHSEIAEKL